MPFGKTVALETIELLEGPISKSPVVRSHYAGDQRFLQTRHHSHNIEERLASTDLAGPTTMNAEAVYRTRIQVFLKWSTLSGLPKRRLQL